MQSVRLLFLFVLMFTQFACFSVPQLIWHQEDVLIQQVQIDASRKILIASRKSDFKEALIEKIIENYKGKNLAIKVIGLAELDQENAEEYQSIILINTCMSWDMDRNVNKFLKNHLDDGNVIVLTTSGDGRWLPKKKGRQFDAISSASKITDVEKVSNEIIEKINHLLN